MKRYEYMTISTLGTDRVLSDEWEKVMNRQGRSGWECYAVTVQFNDHFFHFKRELTD